MTHPFKYSALPMAIAFAACGAFAQDDGASNDDDSGPSWRDSAVARCNDEYSAEQCQDPAFLEERFHVDTLQIAHRTAMQRNQQANAAFRELTLQYACSNSPSASCANNSDSAQCIVALTNACATLKAEAVACLQNVKAQCASADDVGACSKQGAARCPSAKKQPIDQLLAKYPKLSAAQKSRLLQVAAELEAKSSGWWSKLIGWLGTPFN